MNSQENNSNDLPNLLADEAMLSLAEVAERFRVPVTKIGDFLNQHKLVAIKEGPRKVIPEALVRDEESPNKFVAGAITVLADGGYSDEDILRYLFTPDETLPGRPVDALFGNQAREVIRRAQAMAF